MYGLPSPEFYEERDSLKIVFRNSSIMTKEVQGGQNVSEDSVVFIME